MAEVHGHTPREIAQRLQRRDESNHVAALARFGAFRAADAALLLPFLLAMDAVFSVLIVATAMTFFLVGALKIHWPFGQWWRSGIETLAIGAMAAAIVFLVASQFR